ncbi:YtpI family protein [Pontibacillus salicampi]|uniref:YtpI family protein n=1 Tax=Pontibacillus salicampi TaxID=1449801 RepID=A0ABV6LIY5_9BACI
MVIFPIIIVLSFVIYFYFKVAIWRRKDPLTQEYTNAKARIALGIFMTAFGINQYAALQSKLALYICIVFLLFGVTQLVYGYKTTRFYGKQLKERMEQESTS